MYTEETRAQAVALTQGLSFGQGGSKMHPIATITVIYPDGDRKFCQYPESFCEFKEVEGSWEYNQCTCQMEFPSEPMNLWEADQMFPFPDFYDRPVHFARYGDRTALFVSNVCQGFLLEEPSCLCLHSHDFGSGWEPRPSSPPPDRPPRPPQQPD